ncbi:MAG: HD domain-containing protein [Acidobacteriota bacterium]|nr:MAG: HD domain-containing protein [Acidobacteriota bacterium]
MEEKSVSSTVSLYFELFHLKQLYRQGWLQRGIPEARCETVAEHSFAVAMLAMFVADQHFPHLDSERVLRIALIHDLGEIHAGDLTPADQVPSAEKHRQERESLEQVLELHPEKSRYLELWEEYETGRSPEARLVREIEKLEMALQASVYEHEGLSELQEFFTSTQEAVSEPVLREILEELKALRNSTKC